MTRELPIEIQYPLSVLITCVASIQAETEQKLSGGFFSAEYVREKLEHALRALSEIEKLGTINQ